MFYTDFIDLKDKESFQTCGLNCD